MQRQQSEKLKVIIVDDFRIIVERLTRMLTGIPGLLFVGTSDHAESAWHLINQTLPDVVIMDIHLRFAEPKEGVALLNRLKQEWPEMRVIVFSNYADTRYRHLCEINGADFFFDKATDSESLGDMLKTIAQDKLENLANPSSH